MSNFSIITTDKQNELLILLYSSESPFDYFAEISNELKARNYFGTVIIDSMLHSGNNDERFIQCALINGVFNMDSFDFKKIPKGNSFRKPLCDYLKNNLEYTQLSGLTSTQIRLITKGCVI